MNDLAELIEAIIQDQQSERRIARVTVQPSLWQTMLGNMKQVADDWNELTDTESESWPKSGLDPMNIKGVPMEIDEMQEEAFLLWDRGGERLDR
jgi:hypothetical protein